MLYAPALIRFNDHRYAFRCTVRDVTEAGAGITIHDVNLFPSVFCLFLDATSGARWCQLKWRLGSFAGVAFSDESSEAVVPIGLQ